MTIRREIEASTEELFDAWLDPDRLARWMPPSGAAGSVDLDPREGGSFEIVTHTREGALPYRGTYIAIERPRRLVFTWRSPMTSDEEATVTVHFRAAGAKTEVIVTYQPPATAVSM
ncbi:MAG TPA: SRPBCC domain-containing protein [Thermoanaerobaculia bacterium]